MRRRIWHMAERETRWSGDGGRGGSKVGHYQP